MNFQGRLGTDEPPDGDYVRYIEALVGEPPEDAERAAIELAQRLAARRPLTQPVDLTVAQPPTGASGDDRRGGEHGPARAGRSAPDIGFGASAPVPTTTVRRVPSLRQGFARVLVVIGALLLGLALIAPSAISMAPGIVLLISGLAIGRRSRRRAARIPSSGAP